MPGHYGGVNGGDDFVYIDIPEIPDIILQFLNGTLKIHLLGKDENGNEDLCADVTLDVVVPWISWNISIKYKSFYYFSISVKENKSS